MNHSLGRLGVALAVVVASVLVASAQDQRKEWNAPQSPFRIHGNTYYVGTHGLSAILITSDAGHVLIDGGLPESASSIASSIRTLGFRLEDVKLILNSHVHYDHAGGIAELQRLSGAKVTARQASARVLEQGRSGPDDPQFGVLDPIAAVTRVTIVKDKQTLRVGPLALTAHATGGHTPGGTTWTWRACKDGRCLGIVYGDSLTAISADGFKFTASKDYPNALRDFEQAFATMRSLPCDILVTTHPDATELWARVAKREQDPDALIDRTACRRYADAAEARLRTRIDEEKKLTN